MAKRASIQTGPGRRFSSALLFAVGTAATLGTAAGFFGAAWWGFDRLADWRFPFFVVLLGAAILYGFIFRRALSAVFLLAAIVNAVLLACVTVEAMYNLCEVCPSAASRGHVDGTAFV